MRMNDGSPRLKTTRVNKAAKLLLLAVICIVAVLCFVPGHQHTANTADLAGNTPSQVAQSEENPPSEASPTPAQEVSKDLSPQIEPPANEPSQEPLPPDLTTTLFPKEDWHDSGYGTISSTIETYYWSMREKNFTRWLECNSPEEQEAWKGLTKGKIDEHTSTLAASLQNDHVYHIQSAVKFTNDKYHIDEYVLVVQHTSINGKTAQERLAIVKVGKEWKIAGEDGQLYYPHHPSGTSIYDALSRGK
ncbi:MAG: hypothetical protein JWR26_4901 [Pedosphaera sp.]|nr:hypothetical protein [Pedosphaera sp.]